MSYAEAFALLQKVGAHLRLGPSLSGVTRAAALDAYAEVFQWMLTAEAPTPRAPEAGEPGHHPECPAQGDGACECETIRTREAREPGRSGGKP